MPSEEAVLHEPYRLRKYRIFDVGRRHDYFSASPSDALNNQEALMRKARSVYRPLGEHLHLQSREDPSFVAELSITGTGLELLRRYDPFTLRLYQSLARNGHISIRAHTYYDSLANWYSQIEYSRQIALHRQLIEEVFGVTPTHIETSHTSLPEWMNNDMQHAAVADTFHLELAVLKAGSADILEDWRRLQAVDHFKAMSSDYVDAASQEYAQAHGGSYEVYIAHKNALEDLQWRLKEGQEQEIFAWTPVELHI